MVDFTVLIPVFNTPRHIFQEAIDSILKQSLPSQHPIVIVNDGSFKTDTLSMLIDLQRLPEFHVINLKCNKGVSTAMNVGHEYIKSEFVALMGSDDISHPDRFKKQVQFLERYPDTDVLGTQLEMFWDHDPKRKTIPGTIHKAKPIPGKGWQTNHGTVMYRNQAVKDVGGYEPERKRAQDVYLFNRMMDAGKKFHNLSDKLYQWRRYKKE